MKLQLQPRAAATAARASGVTAARVVTGGGSLLRSIPCNDLAFEDRWPSLAQLWSFWWGAPTDTASSERAATAANGKT